MGATTQDIFGKAPVAEPAVPGTYGQAPAGFRLPAETRLGPVRLQVADLDRSVSFYQRTLGLLELERDSSSAVLGAGGTDRDAAVPLVELRERLGTRPAPGRGRLGLFHFALLLPDRPSLGRFVQHLAEIGAHAGAADHRVSEALYLTDPDGLGIEVYADRPRDRWRRLGRELMMATDPLDLDALARDAGETRWQGIPPGTVMGHVHLHVGDLAAASRLYSDALGFDRTVWSYPGALFLAAGGYHHHLGTNVWAGPRAEPPPADEAQLLEWTLELPSTSDLDAAVESLTRAGYPTERLISAALSLRDPWGTPLRLSVARPKAPPGAKEMLQEGSPGVEIGRNRIPSRGKSATTMVLEDRR